MKQEEIDSRNLSDLKDVIIFILSIIGVYGLFHTPNNKLKWILMILVSVVFFYSLVKIQDNNVNSAQTDPTFSLDTDPSFWSTIFS